MVLYPQLPQDNIADGPLDVTEVKVARAYVDFGAIRIINRSDVHLRAEVEEATGTVVAVTVGLRDSNVQLQAFAAPKSEGLWFEVREQLKANFVSQGIKYEERLGAFGYELIANLHGPGVAPGGQLARFVGVDGPRWFLRGIFTGPGATEPVSASEMDDVFRGVIINRGDTPIPPRDLLPLSVPESAMQANRDFLG